MSGGSFRLVVVASVRSRLPAHLGRWARQARVPVKIDVLPPGFTTVPSAPVIVDLARERKIDFNAPLGIDWLLVVLAESQAVPARVVEALHHANARLVVLRQAEIVDYNPVIAHLEHHLIRPAEPWDLVEAVLLSAPMLAPLRELVATVLAHPWRIRRPRDLAIVSRCTRGELKRRCADAGLTRVEHLVSLVRWLGFDHLVKVRHMAPWRARLIVGVPDRSNLLRQVARATYVEGVLSVPVRKTY